MLILEIGVYCCLCSICTRSVVCTHFETSNALTCHMLGPLDAKVVKVMMLHYTLAVNPDHLWAEQELFVAYKY